MEVSLKIYALGQSLVTMTRHYKSLCYKDVYHAESSLFDKLLFQHVLHTESKGLVTHNIYSIFLLDVCPKWLMKNSIP